MRIISHKNTKYDYYNFINNAINNPLIEGIAFDVLMTKDQKIIIYTPTSNYLSNISSIQNNTYDSLKNADIILLDDAISQISNTNKKIIINLLPITSTTINNDNFIDVVKLNRDYVIAVENIINRYQNNKFYLCSAYDNLVYQLKMLDKNHKKGFVITNLSTNYIDVDFYVFTVNVLDEQTINQQLSFNKEVMIYILNCDDMNSIMKEIIKRNINNTLNKKLLNEVYFINNYPELFWKLFN